MGILTAYPSQPYNGLNMAHLNAYNPAATAPGATSNTLASYVIPLTPPTTNSAASASGSSNSSGGMGALPDIPPPSQIAPGVMGSSATATPYNTSQSVPVNNASPEIPPVSDIPPPHMVAPWVFLQRGKNPPQLPQQPAQQPMPTQPKMPQAMPPQQQQPQRPPQQQQPPVPPQQPPAQPQQKKPTAELDGGALSDETIRSLNKRLEDPAEDVRADATIDLFKILEKNAKLADDPNYKPYIDAFSEKIMSDPSPLVRGGGELILKMGKIPNPSQGVRDELKKLSTKDDLTSEGSITSDILSDIETGTLKKSTPPQPPNGANQPGTTNPGAAGMAMPSSPSANPAINPTGSYNAGTPGTQTADQKAAGPSADELAQREAALQQQTQQQRMEQEKLNQQKTEQEKAFQEQQAQAKTQQEELANQKAELEAAQANAPQFGGRLNIISPQQAVYGKPAYSPSGQRLNIQAG